MFKWIRFPKSIALLAFLLPWLTVSCSGQPIAKASGVGLAIGSIDTIGMDHAQLNGQSAFNILLVAAIIIIAVGLFVAFRKPFRAAILTLGTSIISLAFIGLAMTRYSKSYLANVMDPEGADPAASTALRLIEVQYEMGFWICILALIAAAVLSFLSLRHDPDQRLTADPAPPAKS